MGCSRSAGPRRWRGAAVVLLVLTASGCTGNDAEDAGSREGSSASEPSEPTTSAVAEAAPPLGQPTADDAAELLFVIQGGTASASARDDGSWELVIDVPEDDVLTFEDRPHRGAHHGTVQDFVDTWAAFGFDDDPPNAAVTGHSEDGPAVDVAVELRDPSWDAAAGRLTISASPIGDDAGHTLPERFAEVSLFIDDAQNTIQVNLVNLSPVPLSIQSASPDISTWISDQSPAIGFDFGEGSTNGPGLNLGLANPRPGVEFVAQLILVGDYDNQWQLELEWDDNGNPMASLEQLSGQGLGVVEQPAQPGAPPGLTNLNPGSGQTADYQVVWTPQ